MSRCRSAIPQQSATQAQREADSGEGSEKENHCKLVKEKVGAKGGSRTPMGFPARS